MTPLWDTKIAAPTAITVWPVTYQISKQTFNLQKIQVSIKSPSNDKCYNVGVTATLTQAYC